MSHEIFNHLQSRSVRKKGVPLFEKTDVSPSRYPAAKVPGVRPHGIPGIVPLNFEKTNQVLHEKNQRPKAVSIFVFMFLNVFVGCKKNLQGPNKQNPLLRLPLVPDGRCKHRVDPRLRAGLAHEGDGLFEQFNFQKNGWKIHGKFMEKLFSHVNSFSNEELDLGIFVGSKCHENNDPNAKEVFVVRMCCNCFIFKQPAQPVCVFFFFSEYGKHVIAET